MWLGRAGCLFQRSRVIAALTLGIMASTLLLLWEQPARAAISDCDSNQACLWEHAGYGGNYRGLTNPGGWLTLLISAWRKPLSSP